MERMSLTYSASSNSRTLMAASCRISPTANSFETSVRIRSTSRFSSRTSARSARE